MRQQSTSPFIGTQAIIIIIATQDRTSKLRCCYLRALGQYVRTAICAAPRSHGVSEMKSWLTGKKRGGGGARSAKRIWAKAARRRKKSVRLRKV